jgi:tRNA pseudouridine55 synthase
MQGIIILNKPDNMSSQKAVYKVKQILKVDKIGHLGTLDPLAVGVLPIAINNATRLFDYFLDKKKTYRALIKFGETTDTLDSEGVIIDKSDKIISRDSIESVLKTMLGEFFQQPPKFSAKQINGVRAYKLARQCEEVNLKPKKVNIFSLTLIKFIDNIATIDICCSSGTYIRSFARDLGLKLGSVAYMAGLIRLSSGDFNIFNSITLQELENLGEKSVIDTDNLKMPFIDYKTNEKEYFALKNGQIVDTCKEDGLYRCLLNNIFVAVVFVKDKKMKIKTNIRIV